MEGWSLLLLAIGISVLFLWVLKVLAQRVYDETGYNAISVGNQSLIKATFIVPSVAAFIALLMQKNEKQVIILFVATILIFFAILIKRNLAAKKPLYIISLTVLQLFCGFALIAIVFSFWLMKVMLNYAFKDIDEMAAKSRRREKFVYSIRMSDHSTAEKLAREEGFLDANAYAQAEGFKDVADAKERMS